MSLGVVIKGPEGLVLAAESRQTLTVPVAPNQAREVSFDNATKVMGFGEPGGRIGVVTYGLGGIGSRSVYGFMPEFKAIVKNDEIAVAKFAQELVQFFQTQWNKAMPESYQGPGVTFVVGGFDPEDVYGQVYEVNIPSSAELTQHHAGEGSFGITWGGQREIVDRLLRGYDHRVIPLVKELLELPDEDVNRIEETLEQVTLGVPINTLALQDCINLAIFFVRTTIEAQELTIGVRGCGGPIDVAVITQEAGFAWVQHKRMYGQMARRFI